MADRNAPAIPARMMLRTWIGSVLAVAAVTVATMVWVPSADAEPSCPEPRNPLASCSVQQTSHALEPQIWCPSGRRFGFVESGGRCVRRPVPMSWSQTMLVVVAGVAVAVIAYRWMGRRDGQAEHEPTDDDDHGG